MKYFLARKDYDNIPIRITITDIMNTGVDNTRKGNLTDDRCKVGSGFSDWRLRMAGGFW